MSPLGSTRELETGSWQSLKVEANVPEIPVPPEFTESDGVNLAFRLPSGKLISTDMEGNLDRIATTRPDRP
ncbi:MAG: hypothetical protein ACUVXF_01925 [Desulfobaccales bacterium]